MKKLGEEPHTVFKFMWARSNEERLEIIAEIKLEETEFIEYKLKNKKFRVLKR